MEIVIRDTVKTKRYDKSTIDSMIDLLINKIKSSGRQYSCVVGIREGGLNVSVPVARALCLPHHSVHISFYDRENAVGGLVSRDDFVWRENCLVVDDLIDDGKTIECFKCNFGEADVAVLFWHENCRVIPEYYVSVKPPVWVKFPWEIEECQNGNLKVLSVLN